MPASFTELDSMEKLDDLFARSHGSAVIIFKHSASCGVSAFISRRLTEVDAELNVVVVQKNRDVSNAIVEKTGVRHETPQLLIIRDGEAVFHASHYSVTPEVIAAEMENQ